MLQSILDTYEDEKFLTMDGFDEAVIGVETATMRLVYSQSKIMEILKRDMSEIDAIEHFSFNIECAFVDEKQPIICDDVFEIVKSKKNKNVNRKPSKRNGGKI